MPQLRHRDLALFGVLAGCLLVGAGCSATSGSRFRSAEGSRSIASVGDQPLPPTVGASGAQVTVDTPEPEPYRNPKARISGRVVDEQGRPVAGATVRLADGPSKAGRDVRTTTDASGGFTLGGLRPGSGYLLVAEANFGDEQGTVSGRAQADTAATGVQIRLDSAADDAIPPPAKRGQARSSRTKPVSERSDGDDRSTSRTVLNDDDLGPPAGPAGPADEGDDSEPKLPASGRSRPRQLPSSPGWRRPGAPADDDETKPADDVQRTGADVTDPAESADPGAGKRQSLPTVPDDADEVNPLPLSQPSRKSSSGAATATTSQTRRKPRMLPVPDPEPEPQPDDEPAGQLALKNEALPPASTPPDGPSGAMEGLLAMPSLGGREPAATVAAAEPPRDLDLGGVPGLQEPPPAESGVADPVSVATSINPAPAASGASVPALPTAGSAASDEPADPSAPYNPFALVTAVRLEPARPTAPSARESSSSASSTRATAAGGGDEPRVRSESDAGAEAAPAIRKWGELAMGAAAAAGTVAAVDAARPAAGKVSTVAASGGRGASLLARRSRAAAPTPVDAAALCRFDAKTERVIDFQLPDLDGQPVRFRDLDADFVLLDFWGTWCAECLDSIPHLIDLQKRYGLNKLKVVGIACEKTPPERRKALVAAAAQRLGINYSVVVASMDDTDPVQRDLQIRFYPTLVLLNRQGQVVFRAEGGTETNLARLDRALAAGGKALPMARR